MLLCPDMSQTIYYVTGELNNNEYYTHYILFLRDIETNVYAPNYTFHQFLSNSQQSMIMACSLSSGYTSTNLEPYQFDSIYMRLTNKTMDDVMDALFKSKGRGFFQSLNNEQININFIKAHDSMLEFDDLKCTCNATCGCSCTCEQNNTYKHEKRNLVDRIKNKTL